MGFAPTPEQVKIRQAVRDGKSIVIIACAGAGKTSTMLGVGEDALEDHKTGTYIVYNRKAKDDAEKKFKAIGDNIKVKTSHGLAFGPMMKRIFPGRKDAFQRMLEIVDRPKPTRKELVDILNINHGLGDQDTYLDPKKIAGFVTETLKNWCYSEDRTISKWHVPKVAGTEDYRDDFVDLCVTKAKLLWDKTFEAGSRLKMDHDYYLKAFSLDNPKLYGDLIILDEAQDANPVMAQIVNNQTHMQRIMVGDPFQAIYGWRGAVDAMSNFQADERLYLSTSFRFGPAIADEANKWLTLLGAEVMVKGFDKLNTTVEPFDELPKGIAILCRTNAEVMMQALSAQQDGKKVGIVGGASALLAYAEAAVELQAGKGTWHHELMAFKDWAAVQKYCIEEKEEAGSLAVVVKIIDTYGTDTIIEMCKNCVDEFDADIDVIVSTAHKAKGAEWDYVKIGEDFKPTVKQGDDEAQGPSREAMMLAYVSVTRAKVQLDNFGLNWVDDLLGLECNV